MCILVDEFQFDPERVMAMPFVRFLAWQKLAFRRSIARKNRELAAAQTDGGFDAG